MMKKLLSSFLLLALTATHALGLDRLADSFKNPPDELRPMPLWFINGELTSDGIRQQMRDAKEKAGFTGVSPLPWSDVKPTFLTDAYFDRYREIVETARQLGMQVILYDDAGFPSGMAGGQMEARFPQHTRKRLDIVEKRVDGRMRYRDLLPGGVLMSAVAMNQDTKERVDLRPFIRDSKLEWQAPAGKWRVMYFVMVPEGTHKESLQTDYLDPVAVEHLMSLTYEEFAKRLGEHFGKTIRLSFFDDIGFWRYPRGWTGAFNQKFQELNGFDPAPFYPALWHDIGPDTEALRHAFFRTRAELLAEGFPKLVSAWARRNGLQETGHPPGNYDPQPVDMNGDIFKFYRHTAVPLMDSIIGYGFGQNGFKLVSSAADYYDRPLVGVEIYGAFPEDKFDSAMLYRNMMDVFTRGANVVVPHAMWNDIRPGQRRIPPLVSPASQKIVAELPAYSEFVGRASLLLRGGRRVADIGVLYPFEELAGWYRFEEPADLRQGFFISPQTDYQKISGLLSRDLHRDFTFIHPEFFLTEKYTLNNGRIQLNNRENVQEYRALVVTGCRIISLKTLEKIQTHYRNGGLIISTTQLPYKSTELGEDKKVIEIIKDIFGLDPTAAQPSPATHARANERGGRAVFVPAPTKDSLKIVLDQHLREPDVRFLAKPTLPEGPAHLSYLHKVNDGRDVFYFSNSTDVAIETDVLVRGAFKLQIWNPHTGTMEPVETAEFVQENAQAYTRFRLSLPPVRSLFAIGVSADPRQNAKP
jgi:hypothetical protein